MPTIRFRTVEEVGDFQSTETIQKTEEYREDASESTMNKEQSDSEIRIFFPGDDDSAQMFEVRLKPGYVSDPHAHLQDEIIYVKSGELTFGKHACKAGSAVFVPKKTLYGFRVGAEGVEFLNFRPRSDFGTISKEQFMAMRTQNEETSGNAID